MFRSIRSRITTSMMGILLIAALILTASSLFLVRTHMHRMVNSNLEYIARDTSNDIAKLIADKKDLLSRIAGGKEFIDFATYYREEALIDYFQRYTADIPLLSYMDRDGIAEVTAIGKGYKESPNEEDLTGMAAEALQTPNEVILSLPRLSMSLGTPVLPMMIAKHNYFGDVFTGIAYGELPLSMLSHALTDLQFSESGIVSVVDQAGTVVADLHNETNGTSLFSDSSGVNKIASASSRASRMEVRGIDSMSVLAPLEGTSLTLVVAMSYDNYNQASRQLATSGIIIALLTMAIGFMIASRISRRLSRPVSALAEATAKVAAGHFDSKLATNDKSEIGSLVTSFNSMVDELTASREELLSAHDELEQRVQERTTELAEKYEQLETEITERNRAEEELVDSNEELERRNRELQNFLHIASHDLQEPLRKITTFSDRLTARCSESIDEKGHDYLERMQNASKRMQSLIESLLNYSRVSSKAIPFETVNLNEAVEDAVGNLEIPIHTAGATVEVDDLPTVQADPIQMRQMFQNLISNAIKYREDNRPPVVIVSTDYASGEVNDDEKDNHYCRVTVKDNGIGFDKKYAGRIFGIFQRLHGNGAYEGTGIGLSICQKIVERHGGSISADSTPGEGAAFTVMLPSGNAGSEA